MDTRDKDNNLNWLNNLRVLATISVIIVHVSSGILYKYGKVSNYVWWIGNIYDGMVRFCVPIFLMLTGSLVLNRKYILSDFLKKKFSRILLPFLFWSFIYGVLAFKDKFSENPDISSLEIVKWTASLIKSGSSYHLWYVYMIIGIYLFIPIINKWIQNSTEKEMLYFIFIWVFTLFLKKIEIDIKFIYFSGFLGYLVLGYYLSIKSFTIKTNVLRVIAVTLILFGVFVTIFGTYFLTEKTGSFNDYFYEYLSLNVLIASVGVFVFFKSWKISNPIVLSAIDFISKYSYGIYLAHVLVLKMLYFLGINCDFINVIFAIPMITFLCMFISSLLVYCVNKLPYGKYISG